ncbi:MAG: ERAP1-like C-terminal domain-containing protein [Sandaracinaceae bacterium]|nr:ERAP1-like C-terminal domain-containing protein [Sandaracinaceae bacterium]
MRIASSLGSVVALLLFSSCGSSTLPAAQPVTGEFHGPQVIAPTPTGRLPDDVRPLGYAIELSIDPHATRYSGTVSIRVRLAEPRSSIFFHAQGLHFVSAGVGEHHARVSDTEQEGVARLDVDNGPIPAGETTLHFQFDAPFREGGDAVFKTVENGEPYVFTQFEPISARLAFPCFDEPGWKTPIDLSLNVAEDHVAVGNSHVASERVDTATHVKHVQFATTEALPIYLVAFAVGKLDVVDGNAIPANAVRSTPLPFRGVAMRGHGPELQYVMERVPAIIGELERYTGIAYPFDKLDIIAIREFPGAMENAGAVMFDESLLLINPQTFSESQERIVMNVLAHELAHQWFGNLVTMAWWDDLWLNEAFATWMATRVIGAVHPELHPDDDRFAEMSEALHADSRMGARKIRQPIESSHDIINAFDDITYSKGSAVLAMVETWLSDEAFQRGIHAYLTEHARGNATLDDLVRALSASSGRDVGPVLRSLVDQPGAPFVEATLVCDADSAQLTLRQSRYVMLGAPQVGESSWHLPICARYGDARSSHEACTVLGETEGTLDLPDAHGCPRFVTPNAHGRGYYQSVVNLGEHSNDIRALEPRERAMHAKSLVAAMWAGRDGHALLSAEGALRALWPLIADEERIVAEVPMQMVRGLLRTGMFEDLRAAIAERARTTARPLLARIGWAPARGRTEDGDISLFRASVIGFLAFAARDAEVRAEAVRRARAFLGLDGDHQLHPDAVPQDLLGIVLAVAIQDLGAPIFDAMVATHLHSQDAVIQETAIQTLGAAIDPALATRARTLAIESYGSLGLRPILSSQLKDPRTREDAFTWLTGHFEEARAHLQPFVAGYLPRFASGYCGPNDAARLEAFFAPRIASIEGGPPQLRLTLEEVRSCDAFVAAQADSIRSFFNSAPETRPRAPR